MLPYFLIKTVFLSCFMEDSDRAHPVVSFRNCCVIDIGQWLDNNFSTTSRRSAATLFFLWFIISSLRYRWPWCAQLWLACLRTKKRCLSSSKLTVRAKLHFFLLSSTRWLLVSAFFDLDFRCWQLRRQTRRKRPYFLISLPRDTSVYPLEIHVSLFIWVIKSQETLHSFVNHKASSYGYWHWW